MQERERERANFINTFKSTIPDTKYIYCTIFPPRTVVHLNNIHIKRPRTLVFNENCYSVLRTVSYYRGGGSVAERQVLQQQEVWLCFPLQLSGTCNGAVSSRRPAPHDTIGPSTELLTTIGRSWCQSWLPFTVWLLRTPCSKRPWHGRSVLSH